MKMKKAKQEYNGAIVDMHCHVLPGVDDGSETFEQSLAMLRHACREGVQIIAATPHLVCDGSEKFFFIKIRNAYQTLLSLAAEACIPVRIVLGYELLISPSLLHVDNLLEYAVDGAGKLLVEPQPTGRPTELDELLYVLDHSNAGMILAHPERNEWLVRNLAYVRELAARGVMLQVNAGSIMGQWGGGVASFTKKLAESGLVHLIGSDAHSDHSRAPDIRAAVTMISWWVGTRAAASIAHENAEKLFAGNTGTQLAN